MFPCRHALLCALVLLLTSCVPGDASRTSPTAPAPSASLPALTLSPPASQEAPSPPTPTQTSAPAPPQVHFAEASFQVELAVTPDQHALGLMGRSSLEEGHGMLFIFSKDSAPAFWMRNMLIPLDMVWIDASGVVAGVTADVPPAGESGSPPLYYAPRPIRYVLEINAGAAGRAGIRPGSQAVFLGLP